MGKYYTDEELDYFASWLVTGYINGTESRGTIVKKLNDYYSVQDKSSVLNALNLIDAGNFDSNDFPPVTKTPDILREDEVCKKSQKEKASDSNNTKDSKPSNNLKKQGIGLLAFGIFAFIITFLFLRYCEWDLIPCILGLGFITAGFVTLTGGFDMIVKDDSIKEKFFKWITVFFVSCVIGIILMGCGTFFSGIDTGPDYETYYIDENGNGKLDRGEGNYTTDEDGNVVDWDEDRNNFE